MDTGRPPSVEPCLITRFFLYRKKGAEDYSSIHSNTAKCWEKPGTPRSKIFPVPQDKPLG